MYKRRQELKMLSKLLLLTKSLIRGTEEAWCCRCKTQRKVVKLGYVESETKKGIVTRLEGQCTNCEAKTSTVVAHRSISSN